MKLLAIAIVLTLLGGCTARESDDIVKLRLTQEFAKDERTFHECADWARESLGEDASAPEYMELTNSCLHMQTKLRASEADVEKKEQELEAAKRELQEARRQVEDTKGKLESERQRELAETKRELEEEKRKREAAERERQENNTSQPAPVIIVPSTPTPAPSPQTGGQDNSFELWQTYQEWANLHHQIITIQLAIAADPLRLKAVPVAKTMPLAKRALHLAGKLKGYDPKRGYKAVEHLVGSSAIYMIYPDSPDYFFVESLKDWAHLHDELAHRHNDRGEYLSAVSLYSRAIEIQEKSFGKYHPEVADLLVILADAHVRQDDYSLALPLYSRAIEMQEKNLGKHHPEVADLLVILADAHVRRDDYSSALPLYNRVVDMRKRAGFANSSDAFERYDMEEALRLLAGAYYVLNDYSSALPVYHDWLFLRQRINRIENDGEDGTIMVDILADLASAHFELGQYNEALPAWRRALAIYEGIFGKDGSNNPFSYGYAIRDGLATDIRKNGRKNQSRRRARGRIA